jgi:hypothetical protein
MLDVGCWMFFPNRQKEHPTSNGHLAGKTCLTLAPIGAPWNTIPLNLTDNWVNTDYGSNDGQTGQE